MNIVCCVLFAPFLLGLALLATWLLLVFTSFLVSFGANPIASFKFGKWSINVLQTVVLEKVKNIFKEIK